MSQATGIGAGMQSADPATSRTVQGSNFADQLPVKIKPAKNSAVLRPFHQQARFLYKPTPPQRYPR